MVPVRDVRIAEEHLDSFGPVGTRHDLHGRVGRQVVDEVAGGHVAEIVANAYALPSDIVRAASEAMNVTGARGGE